MGNMDITNNYGNALPISSGIHNYMEIMFDGSVRCRVILTQNNNSKTTVISSIPYLINHVFKDAYRLLMGDVLAKHFIYAQKYESLTVVRQFVPDYIFLEDTEEDPEEDPASYYEKLLSMHKNKFGNNLIIESNRVPKNDYELIDKRFFDRIGLKYSVDALFKKLFTSVHTNLGFIDYKK